MSETHDHLASETSNTDHAGGKDETKRLLIVDNERIYLTRLCASMHKLGYQCFHAEGYKEAIKCIPNVRANFAIIDMRLDDGNGLDLISALKTADPKVRCIILTGYANISTTVYAIKQGAHDYLPKPVTPEDLHLSFNSDKTSKPTLPVNPISADRVKWEHIQRIYELCDRNVSETARRLNMHRRTLQRILSKHHPL